MHKAFQAQVQILNLCAAACLAAACSAPPQHAPPVGLYARVTMPANPIRLEASRTAPIIGLIFQGMRLPITGKMSNCEWLKVKLPPMLQQVGDEGWIVGPPEYALIDGGGCADIPDLTPRPPPVG